MKPIAEKFKNEYVVPGLQALDLAGENAVNLVLGTMATESHFRYTKQIVGPALGYCQMEPATHDDLWERYILRKPKLREGFRKLIGSEWPGADELETNHPYAAAMCRVQYLQWPEPIPGDLNGWAHYWKRYYNTLAGKGTPAKFINDWKTYVED